MLLGIAVLVGLAGGPRDARSAPSVVPPSDLVAASPSGDYLVVLDGPTILDLVMPTTAASAGPQVNIWAQGPTFEPSLAGPAGLAPGSATLPSLGGPVAPTQPSAAALAHASDRVHRGQAGVRRALEDRGVAVYSTYDTVANAFLVHARQEVIAPIADEPGVAGVFPAPEVRPLLAAAVPLIGADEVAATLGYTGHGVNIAIVDTGVDYTHRSFGGPGTELAYAQNDPGIVEPGTFPTAKVIGGYDIAGDSYGPGRPPDPDDDPIDRQGHGTHVAGIAAGNTGNPRVYHGVAPGASLVALKIFGQSGGTNLITDAFEWATEANLGLPVPGTGARVDVMNLSVGSSWSEGVLDFMGVVRRANEAGIVIAASAGNDGDVGFVTGSPASSPYALSVASTIAGGARVDKIQTVRNGVVADIEALEGDSGLVVPITSAGEIRAPLAWMGRGCTGDGVATPVANRVALIERGQCTFLEKLSNARAAGALAGVVFTNDSPVTVMGSGSGGAGIPGFMIPRSPGLALEADLQDGQDIDVILSPRFKGTMRQEGLTDVVSDFSSRGPDRHGAVKPNLSAPGSNIAAPRIGSGDGAVSLSGTSMASPMVAGAAAVLVERLRHDGLAAPGVLDGGAGLSAREIAALLVNTADATAWLGDSRLEVPAAMALAGSGRVDVGTAARVGASLTPGGAEGDAEPYAVNLGMPAYREATQIDRSVTLHHLGDAAATYALSVDAIGSARPGVAYSVDPPLVDAGPGAAVPVELHVSLDPSGAGPYTAYGGAYAMRPEGLDPAEAAAHVVAQRVDADGAPIPGDPPARLPVFGLPRPASDLNAPTSALVDPVTGRGAFELVNRNAEAGTASLYHLWAEDPDEPNVAGELDIDRVGIRVTGSGANRRIDFLVHTRAPRHVPIDGQVLIALDTDRNGSMDYGVFNYDVGLWTDTGGGSATPDGSQASIVAPIQSERPLTPSFNRRPPPYYASVGLESRTVVLHAAAADLGYSADAPISFEAVVTLEAAFSDVGATGRQRTDAVPDNGLSGGGLGSGRLTFDSATAAWQADDADLELPGGASATVGFEAPSESLPSRMLVSVPSDIPERDLFEVNLASGVPSATPQATPSPTATPSATVSPTGEATAEETSTPSDATPGGTPEASQTPSGTNPPTATVVTPDPTETPLEATAPATPTSTIASTAVAATATTAATTAVPTAETPSRPSPSATASPTSTPVATPTERPLRVWRRIYIPLALQPFASR